MTRADQSERREEAASGQRVAGRIRGRDGHVIARDEETP
jgi:hypothetical protein